MQRHSHTLSGRRQSDVFGLSRLVEKDKAIAHFTFKLSVLSWLELQTHNDLIAIHHLFRHKIVYRNNYPTANHDNELMHHWINLGSTDLQRKIDADSNTYCQHEHECCIRQLK